MEPRGTAKRVPGRPRIHTEPRTKITAELNARGLADLDLVAVGMDITRTEALDQAIKLWVREVGGIR